MSDSDLVELLRGSIAWIVAVILFVANCWPLLSKKTIPELFADRVKGATKQGEDERAEVARKPSRISVLIQVTSMLIGLAILILLIVPYLAGDSEQTTDNRDLPRNPEIDDSFRDELWGLVDLSAFPAGSALDQVLEDIRQLEGDELVERLFSQHVLQDVNSRRSELSNTFDRRETNEEEVSRVFCSYLHAYFDAHRWMAWMGRRNNYDFHLPEYKSWQRRNDQFLAELRSLLRNQEYSYIRQNCAREPTLRELEEASASGDLE